MLRTDAIVALTTDQVIALTTNQLVALSTSQVAAIEPVDFGVLSTDQIATLTKTQLEALTTDQKAAMTTSQAASWVMHGTPLILDLNGNETLSQSITSGVKFDLFATGVKVNTGWVEAGDGLLVMDRNRDGNINDGSELFGSSTLLANGQRAPDGYAALAVLDTNGDGFITSADQDFQNLNVWVDSNANAVADAGELHTLAELGVTKLNLTAAATTTMDSGNTVGLTSSYETSNGASHLMADVWFVADKTAAYASPQVSIPVVASTLQSDVAGMVDALASFTGMQSEIAAGTGVVKQTSTPDNPSLLSSTKAQVEAFVGQLNQFNADGQLVVVNIGHQVAATLPVRLSAGLTDTTATTPLAVSKT